MKDQPALQCSKSFRDRLLSNEILLGGWLQMASVTSAELLADAGFDWAAVDCEHGLIDLPMAASMLGALEARKVSGLIRLPACDGIWIRRALDAGASGLIVPMVNSVDIAREAVRWTRYPPVGERGFGFSRANGYGARFDEYCAAANKTIALVAQIEHISAVEQIEDILAVQGLDALFIGPYDLAGSMGLVGQPRHPQVLNACECVLQAAQAKNIPAGIHVVSANPQDATPYIEKGFKLIALGIDTLFIRHTACQVLNGARMCATRYDK